MPLDYTQPNWDYFPPKRFNHWDKQPRTKYESDVTSAESWARDNNNPLFDEYWAAFNAIEAASSKKEVTKTKLPSGVIKTSGRVVRLTPPPELVKASYATMDRCFDAIMQQWKMKDVPVPVTPHSDAFEFHAAA